MFDFISISLEKEDCEYLISLLHDEALLSVEAGDYSSARRILNISEEIQYSLDYCKHDDVTSQLI